MSSAPPPATVPVGRDRRLLKVPPPYHLQRTLLCGQAFRWRGEGTIATGIFAGRHVRLEQTVEGIWVEGLWSEEETFRIYRYLGLDEPLAAIEAQLGHDRVLKRIFPSTSGIALLRQDPWECLVSFVISAFNNIPKIEQSLDRLTRRFGEAVGDAGWTFPKPGRLASAGLAELRRCLLGYRARYVKAVARQIAGGELDLDGLIRLPHEEARRQLLALPGVGEKVADCVLLFAYGKGEAFPVDVWVKRAVEHWYFGGRRRTARQIREFARARFGVLAGYAQQHLFYYAREQSRRNRA